MSLLNINAANQSETSGKITVTFQSGGVLPICITGSLTGTAFVDVLDPDTDTRSTANDTLQVQNYNLGYNRAADAWSRIDAVPVGSGTAVFPTSGFGLLTAATMRGFYSRSGAWNRIATAFASGATGFTEGDQFYSGHSLVVSVGDGGIIAHTTPTIDDGEDGTNSLFACAFNMGYDGGAFYRIGVNPHGDLSNTNTLATFRGPAGNNMDVFTESDVTAASGGQTLPNIGVRGSLFIQGRISNSGWIRVGGNNAGDFPNANNGFQLAPGESIELHLENADQVNVIAQVSGDAVNVIAEN